MLKKVKKWLGIEGVKLQLILPEEVQKDQQVIEGKIRFLSKNEQTVSFIKVVMIEKFTRGRKTEKLTDEYQLGAIELNKKILIPAETAVDVHFSLPFEIIQSEMDQLQERNPIWGGLVKVAKRFRGVRSEYFVQAEARADGTKLNPFDKQLVNLVN